MQGKNNKDKATLGHINELWILLWSEPFVGQFVLVKIRDFLRVYVQLFILSFLKHLAAENPEFDRM